MKDADFLAAFEAHAIPRAEWTHAAHLRMAWLQLRRWPFPKALERIRKGIQRYNKSLGNTTGYHDTVTHAFTRLVLSRRPANWRDVAAFLRGNADLLSSARPVLHRYYTKRVLGSERAKRTFVEPDKRPLPKPLLMRWARPSDGARLSEIYRPNVIAGAISFEAAAPSPREMARRVSATMRTHPCLVCEVEGRVVGYAYAARYRERAAYAWCCETSVYIDAAWRRRGVARLLYEALLEGLRRQGFVTAYAVIALPNPASAGFHESFGFERFAVYRGVGFKNGGWRDVGWWSRKLAPRRVPPSGLKNPAADDYQLGWLTIG